MDALNSSPPIIAPGLQSHGQHTAGDRLHAAGSEGGLATLELLPAA